MQQQVICIAFCKRNHNKNNIHLKKFSTQSLPAKIGPKAKGYKLLYCTQREMPHLGQWQQFTG